MAKITNKSTVTSKYSLPDGSQLNAQTESNVSQTENMSVSLVKERSSLRAYGLPGDEIKQTIKFTNNSDYDITNATVTDMISANATCKAGSVYINDSPSPDSNPLAGIALSSPIAKSGGIATITYDLVVDDQPTTDLTTAQATIEYSVAERDDMSEKTNQAEITIETQKLKIEKTSDREAVTSGEQLMFQNVITNEGTLKNTDITFKDDLPAETEFIADSVTINDVAKPGLNPTTGISLEDLAPGAKVTVSFLVKVK